MNKEQQELLDEVYENYLQHYDDEYNEEQKKIQKEPLHWIVMEYTNIRPYPKEMFINKCKTDTEFSERWGCKIVIKELSIQERIKLGNFEFGEAVTDEKCDKQNIPTKLITITYKDKKIESYE